MSCALLAQAAQGELLFSVQPKERFQEYEEHIRREYDWVPKETFVAKRAEILERFLARKRIYTTEHFFAKYEQRARANLRNSIRRLTNS